MAADEAPAKGEGPILKGRVSDELSDLPVDARGGCGGLAAVGRLRRLPEPLGIVTPKVEAERGTFACSDEAPEARAGRTSVRRSFCELRPLL